MILDPGMTSGEDSVGSLSFQNLHSYDPTPNSSGKKRYDQSLYGLYFSIIESSYSVQRLKILEDPITIRN